MEKEIKRRTSTICGGRYRGTVMSFFEKLFGSFSDKELKRINPIKDKVLALEPEMAKLTD